MSKSLSSDFYQKSLCRTCGKESLTHVFSLASTPPGNDFVESSSECHSLPRYPLQIYLCKNCGHVQLGHVVNPELLYQNNYSYVSATSSAFVKHLKDYADEMVENYDIGENSLVVDIGSNDGTCLSFFQDHGAKVHGVDPAENIAEIARKNGIDTTASFFSNDLAVALRIKLGPADFITSHNALAHIDDLDDIVKGVSAWLSDTGVFVFEVGYLSDVVQNIWFDTIYHEHLDYHSVRSLQYLFDRFGMEIFRVDRVSPQGGSIRVFTQKLGGQNAKNISVQELVESEERNGLHKVQTYKSFYENIVATGDSLREILNEIKSSGYTIAGFGAPTKATTLMAQFGIGADHLDFIVDDNPLKQGLFTPIGGIEVLPAKAIYERKPDFVLILAWNFAQPIMDNHSEYRKQGGRFVLPMPKPEIV